MEGDWIAMRTDLHGDPAIMQMAEAMGINEHCIVGYCHAIWSWVSHNCHTGTVTNVTLKGIGRVTNTNDFPIYMANVGWLREVKADGVTSVEVVNFDNWLSQSAKTRLKSAQRKRKQREMDVTLLSHDDCDISVTRGEKRREEKNRKKEPPNPLGNSTPSSDLKLSSRTFDPLTADGVPDGLAAAWSDWCAHRSEIRKPLTPRSVAAQFRQFADWGVPRSIAAVEHTIRNGWQGLREPEAEHASRNGKPYVKPKGFKL